MRKIKTMGMIICLLYPLLGLAEPIEEHNYRMMAMAYDVYEGDEKVGLLSTKITCDEEQRYKIHSEFSASILGSSAQNYSIVGDAWGQCVAGRLIPEYAQQIEAMPHGEFFEKILFDWDKQQAVMKGNLPYKPSYEEQRIALGLGPVYDQESISFQMMLDLVNKRDVSVYQFIDDEAYRVGTYAVVEHEVVTLETLLGQHNAHKITYKKHDDQLTKRITTWYDCARSCAVIKETYQENTEPVMTLIINKLIID